MGEEGDGGSEGRDPVEMTRSEFSMLIAHKISGAMKPDLNQSSNQREGEMSQFDLKPNYNIPIPCDHSFPDSFYFFTLSLSIFSPLFISLSFSLLSPFSRLSSLFMPSLLVSPSSSKLFFSSTDHNLPFSHHTILNDARIRFSHSSQLFFFLFVFSLKMNEERRMVKRRRKEGNFRQGTQDETKDQEMKVKGKKKTNSTGEKEELNKTWR